MDFMFPPKPIEGWFHSVLVVRDLASKRILAAAPVRSADHGATIDVLKALFEEQGEPLVIKSDNGSHFTGEEVRTFLQRRQVLHLRSPTRYPQFNGSVEAGIGALGTWAHHRAAAQGRPGRWTLDDIFAAALTINEFGRPHSVDSPTPNELWRERDADVRLDREEVMHAYHMEHIRAHRDENIAAGATSDAEALRLTRISIVRTLLSFGLMSFSRSRITPGYRFKKYARIP